MTAEGCSRNSRLHFLLDAIILWRSNSRSQTRSISWLQPVQLKVRLWLCHIGIIQPMACNSTPSQYLLNKGTFCL